MQYVQGGLTPKRARPTAQPDTLPAPTAPTLRFGSTILRKHCARQMKNKTLKTFSRVSSYFVLECQRFLAMVYCS
jgi:hypothetical protein